MSRDGSPPGVDRKEGIIYIYILTFIDPHYPGINIAMDPRLEMIEI